MGIWRFPWHKHVEYRVFFIFDTLKTNQLLMNNTNHLWKPSNQKL